MAIGRQCVRHPGSTDRGGRRMLSAHPTPEPGEPDRGPVLRPATPMTSIQQYESPDATEAQHMADQRAADQRAPEPSRTHHDQAFSEQPLSDQAISDQAAQNRPVPSRPGPDRPGQSRPGQEGGGARPARGTARVRPAAPSGADVSGPAAADIQTTSGVPKVVIPAAVTPPAPAPDDDAVSETSSDEEPRPEVADEPEASEATGAQVPSDDVAGAPGGVVDASARAETVSAAEATTATDLSAASDVETAPASAADTQPDSAASDAEAGPTATAEPEPEPATTVSAESEPAATGDAQAEPTATADAEPGPAATGDTQPQSAATAGAEPEPAAPAAPDLTADAEGGPADSVAAEQTATPPAGFAPETGPGTDAEPPTETGLDASAATVAAEAVQVSAEQDAQAPEAAAPVEAAAESNADPAPETADSATESDNEQVAETKGDANSQAEVEVEVSSEREPEADVEVETTPELSDPEATAVLVLPAGTLTGNSPPQAAPIRTEPDEAEPDQAEPAQGEPDQVQPDQAGTEQEEPEPEGPNLEDTVVLRTEPTVEDTVILTLPEAPKPTPADETVVIALRGPDDTVVIPVVSSTASVAPPTDVVTAVIPVVPGRRDGQRTEVAPPPDPGRTPKPARARREPLDLGHAPAVLTISALGVLMVALAYAGGRVSTGNAQFAYWVGQVVVFTPVVVRLLSRRMAGVAESFLLVMGLALHQYLLKWMYSPDQFRFPDELQHWLATTIIVQSGELFQPNPALPPAEHFPGLAELGAAVAEMTGLPVTAAGVIVAGIAHLVFVGVLFAVVLRASNSPAVAGVACATYATALHYLFFNSMFLYQTAALPFFMLAIWAVRRWRAEGGRMFAALAVVSMALTTVSHHVTALALVATLLLLAVAELVVDQPRRWSALAMPGAAAVVVAAWILLVATDVLGYLEEPVDQVVRTVSQLFSGESDPASTSAPVSLGQLVVQGAGLLGLLVLYLAVTRDMVHRRDRDWWRWAAVVGGMVFFAGNGVRFLGQNGPEIAGRLSTFTYIPISILAAIGLVRGVQLIPAKDEFGHRWRAAAPAIDVVMPGGWNLYSRVAAGSAMITLLMIGARAGGWPPIASILPGPYLAGGYERSVDAYGVASADWQRTTLGPGNRVGGDATSVSLASTYGRQDPVREVGSLYYADVWGLEQDDLVQRVHVQYLVVDRRLSTQLPESGAYFESDPRSGQITSPLTVGQLGKFDTLAGMDRLYDNGTVRIYRTGVQ
ncbi:hypothetical protein ACQP2Y_25080 [Actinoplanes sp. CA-051413]|uniref:hypothetical protein n=1 Tax=Actinoplanes sp. CA-051413 TaxID=3239899 RepID=UPI003D987C5C